ncbi:MAG: hypothetical protein IJS74_01055 [Clostridia bacterium]|nr:hypothetical protein [Clostridia bacterium]
MANYENVINKSKAYKMVLKDKDANRLSHTYILISEDQDYAFEFAKKMASVMLDVENKHASLLKIQKDIHPDVLLFGKDSKIMVADAEKIVSDVFVRPFEEDKKIYILYNFDEANEETQNKLLKTIEEPPVSSYFILLAKAEKKLLQTVLSRGKILTLDLISVEDIENMLQSMGIDGKVCKICASCSGGVFVRAYKMATDKEFIKLYDNSLQCLKTMNSSRDVLKFASIFSEKSIDKAEVADLFMGLARDLMMIKAGDTQLIDNKYQRKDLEEIAEGFSLKALYKIIEYCLQLKEDLIYNTNSTSAVDEFLLKIVEAKVKCKM